MARTEYYDLTDHQQSSFETLVDKLNETSGEDHECDSGYVYTEAISAWGDDVAYETIELMEEHTGTEIEWDLQTECGEIAIRFANAESDA